VAKARLPLDQFFLLPFLFSNVAFIGKEWIGFLDDIFIIMLGRTEERNKIGDHFDLQR